MGRRGKGYGSMQKYVMLALLAVVVVGILLLFVVAPVRSLWRDAMFSRRQRRMRRTARGD